MSKLMRSMVAELNTEHAARLAALEAALGRIEEAEELAATLRRHGAGSVHAHGFVLGNGSSISPVQVFLYVSAFGDGAGRLADVLRAADLKLAYINVDSTSHAGELHLAGIDCHIRIDTAECLGIARVTAELEEPAHG